MQELLDISIIVPVKNDMQYIEALIKSILAQDTTLKFEILLIDDGSTDGSVKLASVLLDRNVKKVPYRILSLAKQAKADAGKSYLEGLYDTGKGVAAARNLGIMQSNAEYILFADADDMLAVGALDALWNKAKSKNYDMVVGRTKIMGKALTNANNQAETVLTGEDYLTYYMSDMGGSECWNRLIKRHFLCSKDLFFDQNTPIRESEIWNFKMALAKPSVCITSGYTYMYRDDRVGTIRDIEDNKSLRISLSLLENETDMALEKYPSRTSREFCSVAKYLSGMLRSIIYDIVHTKRDTAFLEEMANSLASKNIRRLFELFADSKNQFEKNIWEASASSFRYFRKRKLLKLLRSQHDEVMSKAFQRIQL